MQDTSKQMPAHCSCKSWVMIELIVRNCSAKTWVVVSRRPQNVCLVRYIVCIKSGFICRPANAKLLLSGYDDDDDDYYAYYAYYAYDYYDDYDDEALAWIQTHKQADNCLPKLRQTQTLLFKFPANFWRISQDKNTKYQRKETRDSQ